MEETCTSLRPADRILFNKICSSFNTDGRRRAEERYFVEGKAEKEYLKDKWELYHILEFARRFLPAYKKELSSFMVGRTLRKGDGNLPGRDWLTNMTNQSTIESQKIRNVFLSMYEVRLLQLAKDPQSKLKELLKNKITEISLEFLVEFLEFCSGSEPYRPLLVFENKKAMDGRIKKIREHIEQQHKKYKQQIEPSVNSGCKNKQSSVFPAEIDHVDDDRSVVIYRENGVFKFREDKQGVSLTNPFQPNNFHANNIASFMDWRHQTTTLIDRDDYLEILHGWAKHRSGKSIITLYGEGGVGKTRLAFEFARKITTESDWICGLAGPDFEGNWSIGRRGIILIVDYPEEYSETVSNFLRDLNRFSPPCDIKIVLLSRKLSSSEKMTLDVRSICSEPIHVKPIRDEESAWALYKNTYENILSHKHFSFRTNRKEISNDKLRQNFTQWINQEELNRSPLLIMGLAIFLSDPSNRATFLYDSDIKSNRIFRYITERELIVSRRELAGLPKNHKSSKVSAELLLLLRGLVSILGYANEEVLRKRISVVKSELEIEFPSLEDLKRLSIWENGGVAAIRPDLVAADILYYSLDGIQKDHQADLVRIFIGLNSDVDPFLENVDIVNNISRISRIFYDVTQRLSLDWDILEKCLVSLRAMHNTALWVVKYFYPDTNDYFGNHIKNLCGEVVLPIVSRMNDSELRFNASDRSMQERKTSDSRLYRFLFCQRRRYPLEAARLLHKLEWAILDVDDLESFLRVYHSDIQYAKVLVRVRNFVEADQILSDTALLVDLSLSRHPSIYPEHVESVETLLDIARLKTEIGSPELGIPLAIKALAIASELKKYCGNENNFLYFSALLELLHFHNYCEVDKLRRLYLEFEVSLETFFNEDDISRMDINGYLLEMVALGDVEKLCKVFKYLMVLDCLKYGYAYVGCLIKKIELSVNEKNYKQARFFHSEALGIVSELVASDSLYLVLLAEVLTLAGKIECYEHQLKIDSMRKAIAIYEQLKYADRSYFYKIIPLFKELYKLLVRGEDEAAGYDIIYYAYKYTFSLGNVSDQDVRYEISEVYVELANYYIQQGRWKDSFHLYRLSANALYEFMDERGFSEKYILSIRNFVLLFESKGWDRFALKADQIVVGTCEKIYKRVGLPISVLVDVFYSCAVKYINFGDYLSAKDLCNKSIYYLNIDDSDDNLILLAAILSKYYRAFFDMGEQRFSQDLICSCLAYYKKIISFGSDEYLPAYGNSILFYLKNYQIDDVYLDDLVSLLDAAMIDGNVKWIQSIEKELVALASSDRFDGFKSTKHYIDSVVEKVRHLN